MKIENFRSIEFWKSACISMTDNSFFELMRSVFGKIKTPFNKQQLLNDLESFLLREDIQNTISSYIDQNDAKIISAIALFGEPVQAQLEDFFLGEYGYAQLQDLIVNMEERFIIYRFTEKKTDIITRNFGFNGMIRSYPQANKPHLKRLALNPVLKTVLLPFAVDTSLLFPPVSEVETQSNINAAVPYCQIIFSDLIVAGLFSFTSQWETFYKSEGVIRKRVMEAGKACFPEINLNQLINSLLVLGLFYIDADKLIPDKKHFDDFSLLSPSERREFFAAALLICNEVSPSDILPPLFKNRIREAAGFIHSLLNSLKKEFQYNKKTLFRMIEVFKAQNGANIITETLIEVLNKTGLIVSTEQETIQLGEIINHSSSNSGNPVIVIDSSFSILVYPEINFTDVISLASFLNIRETGSKLAAPVVHFELNKESAVRAFDNNKTADEIIELLNRLSCKKIDDTLVWNLKDWERRHSEVTLKKGVILSLSEEHQYLIKTKPLAAIIIETLAPGLYLLNENAIEDAADILRKAGIDIIGRFKPVNSQTISAFSSNYYPAPATLITLGLNLRTQDVFSDSNTEKDNVAESASIQSGKYKAILKEMSLNDTEKAELTARIDRRLILCETQLREANLRYEKLEARHMDYAGKQNIAKQAISQHSPVEIIWPGAEKAGIKDGENIFGIPKALEKEGNELFLIIDTMYEQDISIPLAKISLLRRIKKSIFEI